MSDMSITVIYHVMSLVYNNQIICANKRNIAIKKPPYIV